MKNKGRKVLLTLTVIIISAFLIFTWSIDGIVKSGIEDNSSDLMKTEVEVDDVDISLFGGSGSIEGFAVHNPENFSDQTAVSFGKASIKIKLISLLSDQIVVKELRIHEPKVYFEEKGVGINLKKLKDNMALSERQTGDKTVVIEHLLIENGEVTVKTSLDKERTAKAGISSFELINMGKDKNNTVKQSVHQIMQPLLERAIEEAIKSGVMDQIESKARELLEDI